MLPAHGHARVPLLFHPLSSLYHEDDQGFGDGRVRGLLSAETFMRARDAARLNAAAGDGSELLRLSASQAAVQQDKDAKFREHQRVLGRSGAEEVVDEIAAFERRKKIARRKERLEMLADKGHTDEDREANSSDDDEEQDQLGALAPTLLRSPSQLLDGDAWVPAPASLTANPLVLELIARTAPPVLSIGKNTEADGSKVLRFFASPPRSFSPVEFPTSSLAPASPAPSSTARGGPRKAGPPIIRPLPLNNHSPATLEFSYSLSHPCFAVVSSSLPSAAGSESETGKPILSLLPGQNAELDVAFYPPSSTSKQWPMNPTTEINAELVLSFRGGLTQTVPLVAVLDRPAVDCTPRLVNFGKVHTFAGVTTKQPSKLLVNLNEAVLLLTNASQRAVASWRLVHLPASLSKKRDPKLLAKSAMDPKVLRHLANGEFDANLVDGCVDDPSVFVLDKDGGQLGADTLTRQENEREGGDMARKSEVRVQFKPKKAGVLYCSKFCLEVAGGAHFGAKTGVEELVIELRGQGSKRESNDLDYDHTY